MTKLILVQFMTNRDALFEHPVIRVQYSIGYAVSRMGINVLKEKKLEKMLHIADNRYKMTYC